jgi:hypothetical protein
MTEAEDALKAEISSKITLKAIQDKYDPIIKRIVDIQYGPKIV